MAQFRGAPWPTGAAWIRPETVPPGRPLRSATQRVWQEGVASPPGASSTTAPHSLSVAGEGVAHRLHRGVRRSRRTSRTCLHMSVAVQKRTAVPARAPDADETEHQEPIFLEAVLVNRLRAGDFTAQAELFRRYRDLLRYQALKFVGNPALADEIVHDAWINGMNAIHRFEGRSSFATWMTAIVRNEARVTRKREARSLPFSDVAQQSRRGLRARNGVRTGEQLEILPGVDATTPERLLLEKEVRERFQDALRSLSPTQRALVVL